MADSVYNPNTGDIEVSFSSLDKTKAVGGFASVDDTNIMNMSEQNQIYPRQQRTGVQRGDQQINGLIKVVDDSGRTIIMLGYSPGAF